MFAWQTKKLTMILLDDEAKFYSPESLRSLPTAQLMGSAGTITNMRRDNNNR